MLKILRIALSIAFSNLLYFNAVSQSLGVNTTGAPAANSAILDVSSTDKGMLVPRMNKAQKLAITAPATTYRLFTHHLQLPMAMSNMAIMMTMT